MKNVAAYVRVSTQEQADEGYSIGEQQDRLRKYCEAQGWNLIHIYTDPGFSGAKLDRPALQQLISDIPSGTFDTVLVFKLDRLSRSQKDTMYLIEDVFMRNDIDFCSVCESSLNTSTPLGRAMVGILSVFAQLERNNITERMTMGRIGRAKAGKYSGGSCAPFGYRYDKSTDSLVVDDYEAVQVRDIYNLYLNGFDGRSMSFHAILKYLHSRYTIRGNEWANLSTITRILQNPVYKGFIKFGDKIYPGDHEPLISEAQWDSAQAKYASGVRSYSENESHPFRSVHILSGIIKCGLCGGNYGANTVRNKRSTAADKPYYGAYACRQKYSKIHPVTCKNTRYEMNALESQIISEIRSLSMDPDELKKIDSGSDPRFEESYGYITAQKHLDDLEKQSKKLLDLYQMDGIDIDTVAQRLSDLKEEKNRTKVIIQEYEKKKSQEKKVPVESAVETLRTFDDVLASKDRELIRAAVRSLIEKIVAYPDHIEIHWTFA